MCVCVCVYIIYSVREQLLNFTRLVLLKVAEGHQNKDQLRKPFWRWLLSFTIVYNILLIVIAYTRTQQHNGHQAGICSQRCGRRASDSKQHPNDKPLTTVIIRKQLSHYQLINQHTVLAIIYSTAIITLR